jgi:hypothetical protein
MTSHKCTSCDGDYHEIVIGLCAWCLGRRVKDLVGEIELLNDKVLAIASGTVHSEACPGEHGAALLRMEPCVKCQRDRYRQWMYDARRERDLALEWIKALTSRLPNGSIDDDGDGGQKR